LYAPDGTQQTYLRVRELAHRVLTAGHIAVIDGAFLQRWQRDLFCDLANELGIPFVIIDLTVDAATLRERITKRLAGEHDASEAGLAVLDRQIATAQAIAPEERRFTVQCDAGKAAVLPEIRRLRPDLGW
jgi:hypothetical protein